MAYAELSNVVYSWYDVCCGKSAFADVVSDKL
jgi:hypothetical protein